MKAAETPVALDALAYGKTLEFTVPSGFKFTIREQNGNDDDILSNVGQAQEARNFNNFIQGIVISTNFTTSGKLSYNDVLKLKLRDKYVILFMSRIHSLGEVVKFKFNWGPERQGGKDQEFNYEENLTRYLWDYSKPITEFPFEPTQEGFDSQRMKPYVEGSKNIIELDLKSGKKVRMNYMDGFYEEYIFKLKPEDKSKNTDLKARNLEMFIENKWMKVENFTFFSPKDMIELRSVIKAVDPEFNAISELENPVTKETMNFPILNTPDFFFPTEI